MGNFLDNLKHAWNALRNKEPTVHYDVGPSYSYRPDRVRLSRGNERTIVTAIYNRIALDVAAVKVEHVQLDENGRYKETLKTGLNNCLTLEANLDQTSRVFFHDIVLSMFDEGVIAVVPVDTTFDPGLTDAYDVLTMRTAKILQWYPKHVKVQVYNEETGRKQEVILEKKYVSVIENPLFAIINEPNSTMQRLVRKLSLLDAVDEQSGSGKLDLIIQLPYTIKSDARRQQADNRRKDIENQLAGSKYGIAYTDATEKITQLNRPVENNLMKQIEYLTSMLFSQLGITQSILDGTADEQTMLNYWNQTIEPIVSAIVDEMKRKFLTKTARTQGKTIKFFRDPFKLVSLEKLATAADTFTRNQIMTRNEVRDKMFMKPSDDPMADQLFNSNISQPADQQTSNPVEEAAPSEMMEEENYY